MVDTEPILRLAAQIADHLNSEDLDGFVRQAMLCVEIDRGDSTSIFSVSADDRPWVQIAFLDAAAAELEHRRQALIDETDE